MEICLFCGVEIRVVDGTNGLVWVGPDGAEGCFTFGTGPHYPGQDADLFWRGSGGRGLVIDLTGDGTVVVLGDRLVQRQDR